MRRLAGSSVVGRFRCLPHGASASPISAARSIARRARQALRDEPGIGPIAAATLVVEVGEPFRFARESKFARWCGTGAVALSSGEGAGLPVKHRLDFRGNRRINSVLYIASVTQHRDLDDARTYINRKLGEGKTRREPAEPTNATSPTASSDVCGMTKHAGDNDPSQSPLDKRASDSPPSGRPSHLTPPSAKVLRGPVDSALAATVGMEDGASDIATAHRHAMFNAPVARVAS